MGLVINQKNPDIEFSELVGQLKFESDIKINFDELNLPVMCGGPAESARGFMLHSNDFIRDETMKVDDIYGVTGTVEALKEVALGAGPKDIIFALGYAGWTSGQLEEEIQQSAWLVVDPDHELVFAGDHEDKWIRAINKLGIDPAMLSSLSGSA